MVNSLAYDYDRLSKSRVFSSRTGYNREDEAVAGNGVVTENRTECARNSGSGHLSAQSEARQTSQLEHLEAGHDDLGCLAAMCERRQGTNSELPNKLIQIKRL